MVQEDKEWEFYLHKVEKLSFAEFRSKLHEEAGKPEVKKPSTDDLRAIIESSRNVIGMM